MKYNKLVRDKIPEIIQSKGKKPVFHIGSDAEFWKKLKEKLEEEVKEFLADESIEEIADVQEVLDAICVYKKFDKKKLLLIKKKKAKERGVFKKRIILDQVK